MNKTILITFLLVLSSISYSSNDCAITLEITSMLTDELDVEELALLTQEIEEKKGFTDIIVYDLDTEGEMIEGKSANLDIFRFDDLMYSFYYEDSDSEESDYLVQVTQDEKKIKKIAQLINILPSCDELEAKKKMKYSITLPK